MADRSVEVVITLDTDNFEQAVFDAGVLLEVPVKMLPIVALCREDDLETLNPHIATLVRRIERNERMRDMCNEHGWSPEMLAWSMVLHQAAQRLG